jgi:hypothetical protein
MSSNNYFNYVHGEIARKRQLRDPGRMDAPNAPPSRRLEKNSPPYDGNCNASAWANNELRSAPPQ